jgi:ATP-dependent DNA helicase RecG
MTGFFETRIEFLKGVGPAKSELLNKELGIFTYADFIQHYPFRHEDRTKFLKISELSTQEAHVQIKGFITHLKNIGYGRKKRLVARFKDDSGEIDLVWFKGAQWIQKKIQPGVEYVVFGKPSKFGSGINIAHPELEFASSSKVSEGYLQPVYSTTEKLKVRYLDSRAIVKLQATLLKEAASHINETLPEHIIAEYGMIEEPDID